MSKTTKTVTKPVPTRKSAGFAVLSYTKSGIKSPVDTQLPREIFGQKVNAPLIAQAIRVYLSNQRQGNAHTKTRAEVNRTKKKVYKQKGTGGARHGARSAPLYVGGGRSHGPKNFENYNLSLSKKMARMAFVSALSDKAVDKKLVVADLEQIEPKTKVLAGILKKIGYSRATIVHSGSANLYRAGRNIYGVSIIRVQELNVYDAVKSRMLILTQEAVKLLNERMGK